MSRLWYFNPENDLALAAGRPSYTPPDAAVRLRRAGKVLPAWMAAPGDMVLCCGVNAAWWRGCRDRLGLELRPWDGRADIVPEPWGWSEYTRAVLRRAGVSAAALPSDGFLAGLRDLSHRRTAALLRDAVAARINFPIWPGATEIRSVAEAAAYVAAHPGGCVLKLPWSSSGRGIAFVGPGVQLPAHLSGDIRRYGSVMAEPAARKTADFAMLYDVRSDGVVFRGVSVFDTDTHGAYTANAVAPQEHLLDRLSRLYPRERLDAVRDAVAEALSVICAGRYEGPAGVDMLVAESDGGGPVLHAAVEINFRYTMGFVALGVARYTAVPAVMAVERGDTTATCVYDTVDSRFAGGRLALTPPGCDFTFVLMSPFNCGGAYNSSLGQALGQKHLRSIRGDNHWI